MFTHQGSDLKNPDNRLTYSYVFYSFKKLRTNRQNCMKNRIISSDINLQQMEAIYQRANGMPDTAHRHDYYTVLLVESAKGKHYIDYNEFSFGKQEVHFVSPGQVHQVLLTKEPKGTVLTFSKDFLVVNNISESFISNINLFQPYGESPPLKLDHHIFNRLTGLISDMQSCLTTDFKYGAKAAGAMVQLFLIYCNNSSKLDVTQIEEQDASVCILRDFKQLVDEKFMEWHKVKEYANQMNVSAKHLSKTVRSVTGKVAKDFIQDRLILEAKRLLLHTDLSIKEVAYQIGFPEPVHFSGFFKKHVGETPSAFRKRK